MELCFFIYVLINNANRHRSTVQKALFLFLSLIKSILSYWNRISAVEKTCFIEILNADSTSNKFKEENVEIISVHHISRKRWRLQNIDTAWCMYKDLPNAETFIRFTEELTIDKYYCSVINRSIFIPHFMYLITPIYYVSRHTNCSGFERKRKTKTSCFYFVLQHFRFQSGSSNFVTHSMFSYSKLPFGGTFNTITNPIYIEKKNNWSVLLFYFSLPKHIWNVLFVYFNEKVA